MWSLKYVAAWDWSTDILPFRTFIEIMVYMQWQRSEKAGGNVGAWLKMEEQNVSEHVGKV